MEQFIFFTFLFIIEGANKNVLKFVMSHEYIYKKDYLNEHKCII